MRIRAAFLHSGPRDVIIRTGDGRFREENRPVRFSQHLPHTYDFYRMRGCRTSLFEHKKSGAKKYVFAPLSFYRRKILWSSQARLIASGQMLAWTSPTCAFLRSSMQSRLCPMPPPIE